MIRLKWNLADDGACREAIEAAGLYMKAGMIPFVGGLRRSQVVGDEGSVEFRFRPTVSDRLLGSGFLEDEDDGQSQGDG